MSEPLLEDFGDLFLVVCPSCSKRAHVVNHGTNANPSVTLTCTECGHSQTYKSKQGDICKGVDADWYFHLPLWLVASCCGETLWAYNEAHLLFLEQYVGAQLRGRRKDEELGWSNQSLTSRLPAWMKAAKNRTQIMACIAKLKQKLTSAYSN